MARPDFARYRGVGRLPGVRLSLVLFIVALRGIGVARTAAYFSLAPFFGAAIAVVLLRDPVTVPLVAAGT